MNSVQTMRTTAPVKTYIGPDSSRMVGDLLREQGVDSVLIVTDKNIEAAGLLAGVEDSLRTAGCSFIVYDETPADPPDTAVDRMCALCWEKRCQAVIAVGGGSCIDSGKCVAFMQRNPGRIRDYLLDPTLPSRKGVPFIAIPTTSGTGSEVTFGVVITDSQSGRKIGAGGPEFFASAGILDPLLTVGLPRSVTASTAMDAFAHAVESMLSGKSNPTCRLFAGEAVRLIAGNLEAVLSNGQDVSRRQHLMYAAYLAAMSVNDGSCSLGHSIAHVLGAHYHIPHGAACAITVPMTIEFFASIFPERIRALGESMGIATDEAAGPQENGIRIADAVRAMNRRTGIPTLSQLGVPRDDLPDIARQAWEENKHTMLQPAVMCRTVEASDLLASLEKEYLLGQSAEVSRN